MSKLSPGTMIVAIFAVLFGLVGAYAAKKHLSQEQQVAEEKPEPPAAERPRIVPLASADIPAGRKITMGDIVVVPMTQEVIKQRNLPPQFMTHPQQVIGRILREPVGKGQPFVTGGLYPEGMGPSVAERLKPGFRAMTVTIENSASVAGMATPGSQVDVLFRTLPDEDEQLPATTVTLLEHVEVLALGQDVVPGSRAAANDLRRKASANAVTLSVTPEQASALKAVEGRGELSLVMRSPEDDTLTLDAKPKTMESVLGLPKPKKPFVTQIYRRGQLATSVYENGKQRVIEIPAVNLPVPAETVNTQKADKARTVAVTEQQQQL